MAGGRLRQRPDRPAPAVSCSRWRPRPPGGGHRAQAGDIRQAAN